MDHVFFTRIESKGLAHYSYFVADKTDAIVIDPRRDIDIYLTLALQNGCTIRHVFETHRHEDFVVGTPELGARTGASLWHADPELPYTYGAPAEDGQTWKVGRLRLSALRTPGHTPGSLSYVLNDPSGEPWIVFTGDTLFAGDVGRVDLMGMDRAPGLAAELYDSIFAKLLPLGDGIVVCPAHGAGSVCGETIAERTWTTMGIERLRNPKLQVASKEAFIASAAVELERPPYFKRMESYNVLGAPPLAGLPLPRAVSPKHLHAERAGGVVIDTRSETCYGAAHVPESLSLWEEGLSAFAGWYVPYDTPLYVVCDPGHEQEVCTLLSRIGYTDIRGYLAGGMLAWHMGGLPSIATAMTTVQGLCRELDTQGNQSVLDVRTEGERKAQGAIPGALEIPASFIPERYREVPQDTKTYVFCGSGLRSMMVASFLASKGWESIHVVLGGIAGWSSTTCPLEHQSSSEQ